MVSTTANIEARHCRSLTPDGGLASTASRGLRRVAALTRAEAALALPTALLFSGAALLALVWIRLIPDVRAPLGSVEHETLLLGALALIATPTAAAAFGSAREATLAAALRAAPVTAAEAAIARMVGALVAALASTLAVCVLDALVTVSSTTPPESAYSVLLTRHGLREDVEAFAVAAPLITFAVASALQNALAASVVGAALSAALLLPHHVLPGAEGWLAADLRLWARAPLAAPIGVVAATVFAALVAPLRGHRSRSAFRRVVPAVTLIAAAVGARSQYGQALLLPGPSWSAVDARLTLHPSPDGRVVFIESEQKDTWPRTTLWRLDNESLELERVPRPPIGLDWFTSDIRLKGWNAAGTAVDVRDVSPGSAHTPRPLLALGPDGGWIRCEDEQQRLAIVNEGDRSESWQTIHRGDKGYLLRDDGDHKLPWREGQRVAFARDLPHLLVSAFPGEELWTFDGRTGESQGLGIHVPDQERRVLVLVSPDLRWVYFGSDQGPEIVHLESGESKAVAGGRFSRSNRGTIVDREADGWVEWAPGLRRSLPFPFEAQVRHLFDDLWLVACRDGAWIQRTDGAVVKRVHPTKPAGIEGRFPLQ